MNIISIILAALGLSLLVFIHELGHYFVARRVGMRVDVFSIGFGPVLYKWDRNGVRWQICALLFGGYVKIRGMEKEGNKEPYEIPDGFFGKRPIDRIKVAIMGPLVNIAFAFLVFSLIWALGGRLKPFSESTKLVGWVERTSAFAEKGLEPGDEIDKMGRRPYQGMQDLLYNAVIKAKELDIEGQKINYYTGLRTPFNIEVPKAASAVETLTALRPANFLICASIASPSGDEQLSNDALQSGLQVGDRLLWADGILLFSQQELSLVVNSEIALVTVVREGKSFVTRVPRLLVRDIRLLPWEVDEIDDWQHETGLSGDPKARYFLPYKLSRDCVVEGHYSYLDANFVDRLPESEEASLFNIPLQEGDQIIAVDGFATAHIFDLFKQMQSRHVNLIVQRGGDHRLSSREADHYFIESVNWPSVMQLAESIGTGEVVNVEGLELIKPIVPRRATAFDSMSHYYQEREKALAKVRDQAKQQAMRTFLDQEKSKFVLGINLQDVEVRVNTNPVKLFNTVFVDTYRTLYNLITGTLKPKYISGPVGIVQVMQMSWQQGATEALYWLGVISLNLGLLNLLPLPILDGGHICLSLVEMVRKKPLNAKTMQRLIIPFVILLLLFFIFVTWQDIVRIFFR